MKRHVCVNLLASGAAHASSALVRTLMLAILPAFMPTARLAAQTSVREIVVCGIDRSGSAAVFLPTAIGVCAREIAGARGGEVVIVRWISEASYRSREEVVRVYVPTALRCSNPYDGRCKQSAQRADAAAKVAKRVALTTLMAAKPAIARSTDLIGFLQAASDSFGEDTVGAVHRVTIVTDLQDTRGFSGAPQLNGVHVTVVLLNEVDDPASIVRLRQRWIKLLMASGAVEVLFRQPGALR